MLWIFIRISNNDEYVFMVVGDGWKENKLQVIYNWWECVILDKNSSSAFNLNLNLFWIFLRSSVNRVGNRIVVGRMKNCLPKLFKMMATQTRHWISNTTQVCRSRQKTPIYFEISIAVDDIVYTYKLQSLHFWNHFDILTTAQKWIIIYVYLMKMLSVMMYAVWGR